MKKQYDRFQRWCKSPNGQLVIEHSAFSAKTVGLFLIGTALVSPSLGVGLALAGWGIPKLYFKRVHET